MSGVSPREEKEGYGGKDLQKRNVLSLAFTGRRKLISTQLLLVAVCSFTYKSSTSTNGTFTTPNYPGLYPRDTECHYLFYGDGLDRVHIRFIFFDVEGVSPG